MPECIHHWIIDEQGVAEDKENQGRCKKCGETKFFRNWIEIEYRDWSLERLPDYEERWRGG